MRIRKNLAKFIHRLHVDQTSPCSTNSKNNNNFRTKHQEKSDTAKFNKILSTKK